MIIKSIIGLILAIAVGALGVSSLGDGIFGFLDKSKGGKLVEDARELSRIHAIYKTDDQDNRNAFDVAVSFDYEVVETTLGELVKGDIKAATGLFSYFEATGDVLTNGNYLVNASNEISDEVCDKINEMAGMTGVNQVPYTPGADLPTDLQAMASRNTEFFCAQDATNDVNVFAYYLMK
jgi:hypothetical protein